jgi:hypothetical protein
MEHRLDPEKLKKTSDGLAQWITSEFGNAHLAKVAIEVHAFTGEAVARAAAIRRPIWYLRVGIWSVIGLLLAGAVHQLWTHQLHEIVKFMDDTKGAAMWLWAALAVFITLEVRLKRQRAIKAINELRGLAHIVDMHQLAKDEAIDEYRKEDREHMVEYLHACTALLALLSKLGQLYVENFPDETAVKAVNDFEIITTGLSNKIWMKILSMKRFDITLPKPTDPIGVRATEARA